MSQYQTDLEEFFLSRDPSREGYRFSTFEEEILTLQKANPHKPIRCISQWIWLDLRCGLELISLYRDKGLQPTTLSAERIIFDSLDPTTIGRRLNRASPLLAYK